MTHLPQPEPFMAPTLLPIAVEAATLALLGQIIMALDDNPFGASLATPHTIVLPGERGQRRYALHPSLEALLARMTKTGGIRNAVITGANGGNAITLNLGTPTLDAAEFELYTQLVELVDWLNAVAGSTKEMQQLGQQFANLTDLNRSDRVQFNEARHNTYAAIRAALITAFNRALHFTNKTMPGTGR